MPSATPAKELCAQRVTKKSQAIADYQRADRPADDANEDQGEQCPQIEVVGQHGPLGEQLAQHCDEFVEPLFHGKPQLSFAEAKCYGASAGRATAGFKRTASL